MSHYKLKRSTARLSVVIDEKEYAELKRLGEELALSAA